MGEDSTNLDFYLPDEQEDGWGDDKVDDWKDLDKRLQNLPTDGTHDNTAHATDYAETGHTHPASDLEQSSATNGQHLAWDGSAWVPVDPRSDSEVVDAVESHGSKLSANADEIDGYDIQKDGSDGSGIINLKTS
jgi:hypothetical protein